MYNPRSARAVRATEALRTRPRAWHPPAVPGTRGPHPRCVMYNPRSARAVRATEALRTRPRAWHPPAVPGTRVAPALLMYNPRSARAVRATEAPVAPDPVPGTHPPCLAPGPHPRCSCTTPAPLGPFEPRRLLSHPTPCLAPTRRAWHPGLTRVAHVQPPLRSGRSSHGGSCRTRPRAWHPPARTDHRSERAAFPARARPAPREATEGDSPAHRHTEPTTCGQHRAPRGQPRPPSHRTDHVRSTPRTEGDSPAHRHTEPTTCGQHRAPRATAPPTVTPNRPRAVNTAHRRRQPRPPSHRTDHVR